MDDTTVTIFGTGRARRGDSAYDLAYETGKILAQAGFVIANGGYGGAMEAAAKGAAEVGGEIIGVTCSAFKSIANDFITREVVTGSLDERLDTLIKLGQAYVILPGGTGTLLELAKVWEFKNKGFPQAEKPIILVGDFWKPLVELIATDDPDSSKYIKLATGPEQVVKLIVEDRR